MHLRPLLGVLLLTVVTIGAVACSDNQAPTIISSNLVLDTPDATGPYRVTSIIRDDRSVKIANLLFATATASTATLEDAMRVEMEQQDRTTWIGTLPGLPLGTRVTWAVQAEDGQGNVSFDPARSISSTTSTSTTGYVFVVGNIPSKPELLTLWPDMGPTSGGTEVLLVGRDFRDGMVADFGAGRAQTLSVISRTQASVLTPIGPPGLVDVRVLNRDGGEATLVDSFTYFPAPSIDAIIPNSGPTTGGTFVRILGDRFAEGAAFLFDGIAASNVTIISAQEATAITPPHAAGFVTVRVSHPTLGFGDRPNAYEYIPPPQVLSIEPARGPDLGGTFVQVTGTNFQPGALLSFDGIPARQISFVSPQLITGVTQPHPVGAADVTVANPDGQSGTLPDGFFFFGPPEIFAVEPPFSAVEGGAQVTVIGENFEPQTRVELPMGPGLIPMACTYRSPTELDCQTPPGIPGPVSVVVTNSDGRSDSLFDGLIYFVITQLQPDRGPSVGGTPVVINGLFFPPSTSAVFGQNAAGCNFISENRIDCITPPGPRNEFVDVGALPAEPGQVPSLLIDGYFYVAPPEITQLQPSRGPLRGGTVVTVIGRFFQPGITLTVGGQPCQSLVFVSDTQLICTVPPGPPGVAEVFATNPDGQSGSFIGFEYVPVTFDPEWGLVDGFANLRLSSIELSPGAQVTFNGVPASQVTFINDEELMVRTPAMANTGPVQVVVLNPGEPQEVSPDTFSYRIYRSRTRPDMGGLGETIDVMIADLDRDGDNDLVFVNGSTALPEQSETMENLGGGSGFTSRRLGFNSVSNEGNICDINGDGLPDMTWGISGGQIRVFRNTGGFNFSPEVPPTAPGDSFEASFHDINGDSRCDLVNLAINGPDTILLGNGAGTFTVVQNAVPHEAGFIHDHKLDVGDIDGDGDNDMIVVVDDVNFQAPGQRHRIYLNNGNNTFEEDMINAPLMANINGDVFDVRIADIDGDLDMDVIMPNYQRAPAVLLNNGGFLTRAFDRLPNVARGDAAIVLEDIEGDGDPDLYLVSLDAPGPGGSSALFLNDGRGFFFRAAVGEPQLPSGAYRATAGDIDGDGTIDFLLGVVFGPNEMYFALE